MIAVDLFRPQKALALFPDLLNRDLGDTREYFVFVGTFMATPKAMIAIHDLKNEPRIIGAHVIRVRHKAGEMSAAHDNNSGYTKGD